MVCWKTIRVMNLVGCPAADRARHARYYLAMSSSMISLDPYAPLCCYPTSRYARKCELQGTNNSDESMGPTLKRLLVPRCFASYSVAFVLCPRVSMAFAFVLWTTLHDEAPGLTPTYLLSPLIYALESVAWLSRSLNPAYAGTFSNRPLL